MLYLLSLQNLELNAVDSPDMDFLDSTTSQVCSIGCCSSVSLVTCV